MKILSILFLQFLFFVPEAFTQLTQKSNVEESLLILNSASTKQNNRDYVGALKDYNRYIKLTGPDFVSYSLRGYLKELMCDYKGAIEDYTLAIAIAPIPEIKSVYYVSRGMVRFKIKDYVGSLIDYNRSIEIDSTNNVLAYFERGKLNSIQNEYALAINDYSKALRLCKNKKAKIEILNYLGIVKAKYGDLEGACIEWNKSFKLGSKVSNNLILKFCNKR